MANPTEAATGTTARAVGTTAQASETTARAASADRARILVAEDSAVNQAVAAAVLEKAGYDVDTAATGLEAVGAVEAGNYALVLMDISMPELNGFDATAYIRGLDGARGRTPVVALTAHAMPDIRQRCEAAEMDAYLTKPFAAETLVALVERLTGIGALPPDDAASAPPAADTTVLDRSVLADLRRMTDAGILADLIGDFVDEARARVSRLAAAAARGDGATVADEAHALKSSAGTYGAAQIARLAADIEAAQLAAAGSAVQALVRTLPALVEATATDLAAYAEALAAPR